MLELNITIKAQSPATFSEATAAVLQQIEAGHEAGSNYVHDRTCYYEFQVAPEEAEQQPQYGYTLEPLQGSFRATDLQAELEMLPNSEPFYCYEVTVIENNQPRAETAELLWLPADPHNPEGYGRGGFAWGADATWTDADSPEDCVNRCLNTGEVQN